MGIRKLEARYVIFLAETISMILHSCLNQKSECFVFTISRESIAHFPTELKQCGKFDHRSDTCFLKAKRVYKKTSLTVKSNNSGFWSYFVSKLRNFETRFQARDTWPRAI